MNESEVLQTFAEVGVALTGFTGIVAVFGRRANEAWSPVETAQLQDLLWSSLNVVVFAFLPLVLVRALSPEATWRVAAGLFALSGLTAGVGYWIRGSQLLKNGSPVPTWGLRLAYALSPVALGIIVAKILVACGFLVSHAAFIYLAALLWSLSVAILNFVFLLLPSSEPAA